MAELEEDAAWHRSLTCCLQNMSAVLTTPLGLVVSILWPGS